MYCEELDEYFEPELNNKPDNDELLEQDNLERARDMQEYLR